jgi:DNA-binding transcriptional LysR family regulator
LDQYLSLGHVHVSSRRGGVGHVDAALSRLGKQRRIQARTKHHLVAPTLIKNSNLALTAPRALAKDTSLKVVPLPFEVESIVWHLYWHRSTDKDKANRWLRQCLKDVVARPRFQA